MLFEYLRAEGKPDYVYFQYTGLSRVDLPFDKKVKLDDYQFQHLTPFKNWVTSGGWNGSWTDQNILRKIFVYMYNIKTPETMNDLSLQNIFTGFELCKKLNINYNWSSYYDYTVAINDEVKKDGIISKLPAYIDTSKHIKAFPLEHAYEIGDIPKDKIHYNSNVLESFLLKYKDRFNI